MVSLTEIEGMFLVDASLEKATCNGIRIGWLFNVENGVWLGNLWQALTVLEYLVANGAERVIDELQEHTYQIQVDTPADCECVGFKYDSRKLSKSESVKIILLWRLWFPTWHLFRVQTLCDFQYLEASGKDQGINVRKKAQTLVALIKDKDRIREVRSKAAANRDK